MTTDDMTEQTTTQKTQTTNITNARRGDVKPPTRRIELGPLAQDAVDWMRRHPLTVIFAAMTLAINIGFALWCMATGSAYPPLFGRISYRRLAHGMFYAVPLALMLVGHPLRLLLDVPALMAAGSVAESRFGAAKTIWISLICSIGGLAAGMGVSVMVNGHLPIWHSMMRFGYVLGPLTLAVGPVMAASAFSSLMWRRRVRVVVYAVAAALVLYRGEPGDYCIMFAAAFGHLLGYLMSPSASGEEQATQTRMRITRIEARKMTGVLTAVCALGPLAALMSPVHRGPLSTLGLLMGPNRFDYTRLHECLAGAGTADCFLQYRVQRVSMPGGVIVSVLPLLMMLVVAYGLYRGRRLAAWLSIMLNACTVVMALLYCFIFPIVQSPDGIRSLIMHGAVRTAFSTATLPLACIVIVALTLRSFPLAIRWERLVVALSIVVAVFVMLCIVYVGTGLARPAEFSTAPSLAMLLADLPQRFVPIGFLNGLAPLFLPASAFTSAVYQGIGPVFWIVALMVTLWCFLDSSMQGERERHQASQLVEVDGESMSFMGTWSGNRYWFSESGRSVIAYRVVYGIALTVTGPFGDRGEWSRDLKDFAAFCAEHSWTPVFYSVHEAQRDELSAMGFTSLDVGTEMVVRPEQWQTRGRKWQDVRTAINKAKREGIVDVMCSFDEAPLGVQSQIIDISEQWAEEKSLPEMKFTLGGVDELIDPRVRLLYALDGDGIVQAVTSWLPTWRGGVIVGWTLDFMRHRPESPNGVMEFLIARMAERLRDEGAEFMSLSAAPLAGISVMDGVDGENGDADGGRSAVPDSGTVFLQHVLMSVADIIEPVYGFHSLFRFKRKFQPEEQGVYIAYPDAAKLPQIALAVVQSYLPDMKPADVARFVRALGQ
ncbi:lysyl-tRNA synthetase [Bifidobacterium margollesii]|uniref:Lysyl-tRNA synthetase n=1 Tax=Bifidobacterium margollesii TaxID=2020964 RepID=A0A2N5JBT8_9BIFI|nr:DUF2156 domain-containing protein [Bifidobacterium margollesii]PLS31680.1 lysyl-tRNA synthetase [Bifidobacterium margollesii]